MSFWEWLRNVAFRKSLRKALDEGIQNVFFFFYTIKIYFQSYDSISLFIENILNEIQQSSRLDNFVQAGL